jgi:23S rRNA (uracil1939-C5)-methyltransferase
MPARVGVRNGTAHRKQPPAPLTTTVTRVGGDGDGIAAMPDGTPLYLPLTLPGEQVRAHPVSRHGEGWLAGAETVLAPNPSRIAPPCRHFGSCGGCVLQHWDTAGYQGWKAALLTAALHRAGFVEPPVAPIRPGHQAERRRMDLAARRTQSGMKLGLHRLRSSDVVDLTECQVLHPELFSLLDPLRRVLARMQSVRREASVVANLLDSGVDLLVRTDAALPLADRTALTEFARAHRLPRIAWARGGDVPEPVCILRPPTTLLSGIVVTPPPGTFLQATQRGEAAIIAAVLAGVGDKMPARARIADLYAGCGTLSFALVGRARVAAWDADAAPVAALRAGANHAGLAGRIEATQRDLSRQPLLATELDGFAAIVLDPPHAGAPAQTAQIAAARVPAVIYVSCNPAALSRDARVLREAGYRLEAAVPIDQFLWSARLEAVCTFRL